MLTAGLERGKIVLCVSGVVTRQVKTCLQVVGWSAWTVYLSSCWPVLDEVQDQVGHCCFSYHLQTQLRTFQANLGWWVETTSKPRQIAGFDPKPGKALELLFVSLGDDGERREMEENLCGSGIGVRP